jgi:intein/homing endonuclease
VVVRKKVISTRHYPKYIMEIERIFMDKNDIFLKMDSKDWYIFGFICADGYVTRMPRNGGVIEITLDKKDLNLLEQIASYWETPIKNKKPNAIRITLCRRAVVDRLIQMGIPEKDKSLNLRWIPNIPDNFINHFVRGYFDGDGYVRTIWSKRFGHKYLNLEYSMLGTSEFLSGIRNHFSNYYQKDTGSLRDQSKWYRAFRLTFSTKAARYFGKWIYSNMNSDDLFLERKRKIYANFPTIG